MDIEKLMTALDNENNEELLNIDSKKISKMKNDILQKLGLNRKQLKEFHTKLKDYRYVDELPDLKCGRFIRCIDLRKPDNIKLTNGSIICDIKIEDDSIAVVCKNYMNRHYQFDMSNMLIFQKLTDQERIILSALDYLNK